MFKVGDEVLISERFHNYFKEPISKNTIFIVYGKSSSKRQVFLYFKYSKDIDKHLPDIRINRTLVGNFIFHEDYISIFNKKKLLLKDFV